MTNVYINKDGGWITIGDTRSQNLPYGWTINYTNIRKAMKLYLIKAVVAGESYMFQYDDCGDAWEALECFFHEDYPEILNEKGDGFFPIDVIAIDGGKAIRVYNFMFNLAVFHAFFDHGRTAAGLYTLSQFAKDIARQKADTMMHRHL